MQGYWATAGTNPPVTFLDVDSTPTGGDPYVSLKTGFLAAKTSVAMDAVAQGATDGGAGAVVQSYHGAPVPPFCVTAARSFFAARRAR